MSYTSYSDINQYGEVSFIAGGDIVFEFTIYDANGLSDMLGATSIIWRMCKFGEPDNNIIELQASEEDPSDDTYPVYVEQNQPWKIKVKIPIADTENLFGKFTHQLIITINQAVFNPAQGNILIIPKIK